MHGLVKRKVGGVPIKFDPTQAKLVIETLQAAVKVAVAMREWEAAERAAEKMVEWQRDFVAWWKAKVSVRESAGNNQRKRSRADLRSTITMAKAERATKIAHQQVSRWRNGLKRPDYANRLFNLAYKKAMADSAARRADLQTGEMEWYTPELYIEKARRVLGQIDLDPASCDLAQNVVKAKNFFTEHDNGLVQDWHGMVWLNPPYSGKLVAAFAAKMLEQLECGNVTGAIMLTNSYTETAWWHNLARPSNAVCFTRGRIKFISPHNEKCSPTNGQSFFYFGRERERFITEFDAVGTILVLP